MTISTKLIKLENIEVPKDRLRELQPDKVNEMAESIKKGTGALLQPIMVRPKPKGGGYLLVFGRHRLEAERKLGHKTIECRCADKMTEDEARLAEVDENLCRANLTPSERAKHIRERKKIFEKTHPETKRGSGGGRAKAAKSKGAKAQNEPKQDTVVDEISKKTGKSRSAVKRDIARSKVDPQALDDLNGTCLDTGVELDALVKLSVDEQRDLAARAKAGETVTAVKPKDSKPKAKAEPVDTEPDTVRQVDDLHLSAHITDSLKGGGVVSIDDLAKKTEGDILRMSNLSRKALNEIKEVLAQMGLHLGCSQPGANGNGSDPDESAAEAKAFHKANEEANENEEVPATKPKPAPSKSAKALAEFKVACDNFKVACGHWLPQMDKDDRAEAEKYAGLVKVSETLPVDADATTIQAVSS
jgi:ParB/RepB/Spo0J family partition protein